MEIPENVGQRHILGLKNTKRKIKAELFLNLHEFISPLFFFIHELLLEGDFRANAWFKKWKFLELLPFRQLQQTPCPFLFKIVKNMSFLKGPEFILFNLHQIFFIQMRIVGDYIGSKWMGKWFKTLIWIMVLKLLRKWVKICWFCCVLLLTGNGWTTWNFGEIPTSYCRI